MRKTLICDCGNPGHQMIIDIGDEGFVTVWIHLTRNPSFFSRLKYAVRYLFGYDNHGYTYGFEEIILGDKQVDELISALNTWKIDNMEVVEVDEDDS
jgi:hypothetical protein